MMKNVNEVRVRCVKKKKMSDTLKYCCACTGEDRPTILEFIEFLCG